MMIGASNVLEIFAARRRGNRREPREPRAHQGPTKGPPSPSFNLGCEAAKQLDHQRCAKISPKVVKAREASARVPCVLVEFDVPCGRAVGTCVNIAGFQTIEDENLFIFIFFTIFCVLLQNDEASQ